MIIKDLLAQLETVAHPLAKAIHKGEHFKVLAIAFKKGMILKEHRTQLAAKLTVLSGAVVYKEGMVEKTLLQYHETDIPVNVVHSVEALEDSLCLLTQG